MTTILVSAGDASGDLHAAALVRELHSRHPGIRFVGLGGDEAKAAGVDLWFHQRDLAIGGLLELASGIPRLRGAWRTMCSRLEREDVDLAVLVDSGGFNLPLARRIRRHDGVSILYYIAPQAWAWRRGRIRKIASRVDRLAVIFPFEPAYYEGTQLDVEYVGHPLVEDLEALGRSLDRSAARRSLGLRGAEIVVAIFPGSRRNEVEAQLPIQLDAARDLHARRPEVVFLLVVAPSLSRASIDKIVKHVALPATLRLEVREGRSREALIACDAALAKPGTITVEAALLARPMVVVGRVNWLTAVVLRRAVMLPYYAMPNIVLGASAVPEFLQENAQPGPIADALDALLREPARGRQLEALAEVRERLGRGGAARQVAGIAEEMLGLAPA